MASELRVNTLKDAAGNNSVGMTYVANGSAKAWVHINMSTGTNVDSFNIASITDDGTGTFDATYTTAQATANYMIATAGDDNSGNNADLISIIGAPTNQAQLGVWRSGFGRSDTTKACAVIHGDLA